MAGAFKPDGWPTLIPRVFTSDVAGLNGFLRQVFGASVHEHDHAPSEVWIDGSMLMVSDGGGVRAPAPAFLYIYVPDADAAYARALAAGAEPIEAPVDMPYGDRRASVRDPWGGTWQIATRR